jgi:hypothetical protein
MRPSATHPATKLSPCSLAAGGDSGERMGNAIAAMAGLQPLGTTLDTADVQTKTPFLIKGVLREYQQIGLDWLVTLYHKRLNGGWGSKWAMLVGACAACPGRWGGCGLWSCVVFATCALLALSRCTCGPSLWLLRFACRRHPGG